MNRQNFESFVRAVFVLIMLACAVVIITASGCASAPSGEIQIVEVAAEERPLERLARPLAKLPTQVGDRLEYGMDANEAVGIMADLFPHDGQTVVSGRPISPEVYMLVITHPSSKLQGVLFVDLDGRLLGAKILEVKFYLAPQPEAPLDTTKEGKPQ